MFRMLAGGYYRLNPSWNIYHSLLHSCLLSLDELEKIQVEKLNKITKYMFVSNSYYREKYSSVSNLINGIHYLDELQRLPVLEKNEIAFLRGSIRPNSNTITKRSGGTTGEPITTYVSATHQYYSMAAMLRFFNWIGFNIGDRRAKLFAAPTQTGIPETNIITRLRNILSNTLFLDALHLTPSNMYYLINSLQKHSPKLLYGYTSSLTILARYMLDHEINLALPNLKIVNSAEPLDDVRKEIIELGFKGKIYNHYGSRDVGYIAEECEYRSGLHVNMEYLIVEIVDEHGNHVKEGEEGDILITELENYLMPLIRYRIGDRATRTSKSCECGRGLQVIPTIIGRNVDIIRLPDGNKITGLVFPHLLKDFPIREYQIVQKDVERIEVYLVLDDCADNKVTENIRISLESILYGLDLEMHVVDNIKRSSSGKLRSVISELTL